MTHTNITGFQRMRRMRALKESKTINSKGEEEKALKEASEPLNDVSTMNLEEVKAELDRLGIQYPHNTGEAKLRKKLEGVINGAN